MIVLGIDLETTSLDTETCEIIEVGAVLWHVESKSPLKYFGSMIARAKYLSKDIVDITHIEESHPSKYGYDSDYVINEVRDMLLEADACVAYNGASFDEKILRRYLSGCNNKPCIDPMVDFKIPFKGSLILEAAKKGFVNPFPHRALTDVLTMMRVVQDEDFEYALESAKHKFVTIGAVGLPFERKDEASSRGYRWDSKVKLWKKPTREHNLPTEQEWFKGCRVIPSL